jgi:hypothetical protein
VPRRPLKTTRFPGCPGRPRKARCVVPPDMKRCGRCHLTLPRVEFAWDESAPECLQSECRNCRRERYLQRKTSPGGHRGDPRGPHKRHEPPTGGAFPLVVRGKHDPIITSEKVVPAFALILRMLALTTASQREIARVCACSTRTVARLWRLMKRTPLGPKHRPTYRGPISGQYAKEVMARVRPLLTGNPEANPADDSARNEDEKRLAEAEELNARGEELAQEEKRFARWVSAWGAKADALVERAAKRKAEN